MKIIKLDAIDSTNNFLKGLNQNEATENFTIVTAKHQFAGKGQMGSSWESEEDKNLIMSILIKNIPFTIQDIFCLNIVIANSIIKVLKKYKIPNLNIKWPNDILAENKKIAGILIENNIKENNKIDSVIGIGLNVNQTNFENLAKASSLKIITDNSFDIDELIIAIGNEIENIFSNEINQDFTETEWNYYLSNLYKRGIPAVFQNTNNDKFMGIIQDVSKEGLLQVMLEDDSIRQYNIKEISLLY